MWRQLSTRAQVASDDRIVGEETSTHAATPMRHAQGHNAGWDRFPTDKQNNERLNGDVLPASHIFSRHTHTTSSSIITQSVQL
jgi:hypothetical protein